MIYIYTTNEKFHTEISKFFASKGLGFKVKEKETKFSEVDELKRLFGEKLIIKSKTERFD